jgi:hypothetical protein
MWLFIYTFRNVQIPSLSAHKFMFKQAPLLKMLDVSFVKKVHDRLSHHCFFSTQTIKKNTYRPFFDTDDQKEHLSPFFRQTIKKEHYHSDQG